MQKYLALSGLTMAAGLALFVSAFTNIEDKNAIDRLIGGLFLSHAAVVPLEMAKRSSH